MDQILFAITVSLVGLHIIHITLNSLAYPLSILLVGRLHGARWQYGRPAQTKRGMRLAAVQGRRAF